MDCRYRFDCRIPSVMSWVAEEQLPRQFRPPKQVHKLLVRRVGEAKAAEGTAQSKEAVQSDKADEEGRHFTGHHRLRASDLTNNAFPPLVAMPEVFPTVDLISHTDNGQIDPHKEVGHREIGDENVEAAQDCAFVLKVESCHRAASVADNRE